MNTERTPHRTLEALLPPPFEKAIALVKAAFKTEGFGTLTEVDVTKTLNDKIGEQIEPYTILGMCNPHLAARAIKIEHEIGLLLPCNVLVHECDGQVHVRAQDPMDLMQMIGNAELNPIAEEATARIQRAIRALATNGNEPQ